MHFENKTDPRGPVLRNKYDRLDCKGVFVEKTFYNLVYKLALIQFILHIKAISSGLLARRHAVT